ncbi:MAG: ABC transporter ATP-binding protein [Thermoanaerobaculia bacterium]
MGEAASPHRDEEALGSAFEPRLPRRLASLARPYRRYVAGSVAVLLAESAVQLTGPLLTAAAVDLVFMKESTGSSSAVRAVASFFRLAGVDVTGPRGLEWLAGLFVATALAGFVLTFVMVTWTSRMGQGVMYDLRKAIFGHLQRSDVSLFDKTPVGRLMTRLTTDVDALNELFTSGFVALVGDVVVLAGIVALLFTMNAPLAALTFAILLPMLWVTNWFRKGARDTYRDVRVKIARVNAFLQEHLSGIGVVQLFRRESVARRDFSAVNDAHRVANINSIFYYAVFYPALDFLSALGMATIVWYGGFQVIRGSMTIGALYAFLQYSKRFYRPLMDLSEKYNILQAAMASSERIFQLLDTLPAITAPPDPLPVPSPIRGEVVFDGVRFAYKSGEPVLKGVSFRVPPGETVALVGATGAGKSTILNLLLRFYDVTEGGIAVDGVDVRRFDPVVFRERFGIVQQDTFLFSGTIAENVSFFDPSRPREAIEAACRDVGLGRLLDRLPEGIDTRLSERGGGLSVGEKQLVSFARALVRDPRILILDEATSSVDPETEALIEAAIARLLAGRTSIVVAHRLSTVVRASRILVLSHGEVRESGTHEELLAKGGLYARLYALQLKDREAAA